MAKYWIETRSEASANAVTKYIVNSLGGSVSDRYWRNPNSLVLIAQVNLPSLDLRSVGIPNQDVDELDSLVLAR